MPPQTVAVVVPHFAPELTVDERISLRHLQHHLRAYDCYQVVPESLDAVLDGLAVARFPDRFFTSAASFSTLQLTRAFYRRFEGYEHILMYQLDALALSDRLLEFCAGDYDYIGAPWVGAPWLERPAVGNGGFSLRRVPSFLRALESRRAQAREATGRPRPGSVRYRIGDNEDIFWSFEAPEVDPDFRIAPVEEALTFAFELAPRTCFQLNGRRLPFGCHAWARYGRDFWEPHLLGG